MHFSPIKKFSIWNSSANISRAPAHNVQKRRDHRALEPPPLAVWPWRRPPADPSLSFLNLINEPDVRQALSRVKVLKLENLRCLPRPREACRTQPWAGPGYPRDDVIHKKTSCCSSSSDQPLKKRYPRPLLEGPDFHHI